VKSASSVFDITGRHVLVLQPGPQRRLAPCSGRYCEPEGIISGGPYPGSLLLKVAFALQVLLDLADERGCFL